MSHNCNCIILLPIFFQHLFHLSTSSSQFFIAFYDFRPSNCGTELFLLFFKTVVFVDFEEFLKSLLIFFIQDFSYFPIFSVIRNMLKVKSRVLFHFFFHRNAHITTIAKRFCDLWSYYDWNSKISEHNSCCFKCSSQRRDNNNFYFFKICIEFSFKALLNSIFREFSINVLRIVECTTIISFFTLVEFGACMAKTEYIILFWLSLHC